MRSEALKPGGLQELATQGVVVMRGLLTPQECVALAPPDSLGWNAETHDDPARDWAHSPEYRFGPKATEVSPALKQLLTEFRSLVQTTATIEQIPELAKWGEPKHAGYRAALVGLKRVVYGGKWHRTPANHQIGWHTDDTFDLADRSKGEVPNRALGMMVAINLSEHGGAYEYAPSWAERDNLGAPIDPQLITRIEDIAQGDAVGFCTARTLRGDTWQGSFPLHRFITDSGQTTAFRESLVIYHRYVADLTLREIGARGLMRELKHRVTAHFDDALPRAA